MLEYPPLAQAKQPQQAASEDQGCAGDGDGDGLCGDGDIVEQIGEIGGKVEIIIQIEALSGWVSDVRRKRACASVRISEVKGRCLSFYKFT